MATMSERLRPLPVDITINDKMRFWNFQDRSGGPDACWPWTGCVNVSTDLYGSEYARCGMFRLNRGTYYAPRLAYYFEYRVDPGDKEVCHECDNPLCVNPSHLFLGTHSDNMRDRFGKDRGHHRGSNNPQASLTEDDVREIRRRLDAGEGTTAIAKSYGVWKTTIHKIKIGESWKHVR